MRYYYLDSARAIFMILGVFYHTALIYSNDIIWRVSSSYSNIFFDLFSQFLHLFRMDGFYIIAGFFSALILKKKGLNFFLKDRVVRFMIPMFFIGFTLNYYMNRLSYNKEYNNDFILYLLKGEWLGHLWFLGNLIIYILISVLLIIKYEKSIENLKIKKTYNLIFVFCLLSFIFYSIGYVFDKILIDRIFFITFSNLFEYFPSFIFGLYLYFHKKYLEKILSINILKKYFFISIPVFIIYFYIHTYLDHIFFLKIISIFLGILLSIVFSLYFIKLFKNINYLNQYNKNINKLAQSSYTIYLLHQPFIIFLFYLIEPLNIQLGGFILITTITLFSTIFIHFYIVEKFTIFALLINGKKIKKNKKVTIL